ncbi:low affinity immunoglobulin epsilon Fc receptor-like [Crassostrea virginica]
MKLPSAISILFYFVIQDSAESCHVGWIQFQEKCYFFSHTSATWYEAGDTCTQFHSKLAEPKTVAETNFLKSHSQSLDRTMWIGVSDIIEEDRWVYSSSQEVVSHTDFGPREPNGHTGENCIALAQSFHGQWIDLSCAAKEFFVCEEIKLQVLNLKSVSDVSSNIAVFHIF